MNKRAINREETARQAAIDAMSKSTAIDLAQIAQQLQAQVAYPQLGIDIQPTGATLIIVLGPSTTITQGVSAAAMDDICIKWQSRHKEE
jgi:hypothetical protein